MMMVSTKTNKAFVKLFLLCLPFRETHPFSPPPSAHINGEGRNGRCACFTRKAQASGIKGKNGETKVARQEEPGTVLKINRDSSRAS
jgi:hypothetical protein